MRGIQIWSQNSNWIAFDHILAKKNFRKLAKSSILPGFDVFLGQKGGQVLSDLNFETRSLGHLSIEHCKHWTALIKVHFLEHKMKGIKNYIFGHF